MVWARSLLDGLDGEALVAALWKRLLGEDPEEEWIAEDPVMVRYEALAGTLAFRAGSVCVVGGPGAAAALGFGAWRRFGALH